MESNGRYKVFLSVYFIRKLSDTSGSLCGLSHLCVEVKPLTVNTIEESKKEESTSITGIQQVSAILFLAELIYDLNLLTTTVHVTMLSVSRL